MLQRLTVSKTLIITGILVLFQLQFGPTFISKAQSSNSLQDQMNTQLNQLLSNNNQSSISNLNLATLSLKSPEDLPKQDIYLRIHTSLTTDIESDIYEAVSASTGYSTSVVKGVVESGVLLLPDYQIQDPDIISQTDIYNQIRQIYKQEKEFFTNISKLKQYSYIHEIFTDGDPTNSGFDLVYDLNQIEEKLFQESTRPSIRPTNLSSNPWSQLLGTSGLNLNLDSITNTTLPNSDSNQVISEPTTPQLQPTPNYQFEQIQYGQVCHIDEKLKQELDIYIDQQENSSTNNNNSSSPNNSSSSNQAQNTVSTTPSFDNSFLASSNQCPADQVFCFTREIKYNKIQLKYPETSSSNQDCIACVVNRISNSLQTLLDNGVLPRKITGNFGEPPLCKKAAIGDIGLNLHLIPKPVLPPSPDSTLITGLNSELIEITSSQQKSISNDPNFSITQETRLDTSKDLINQQQQSQAISNLDSTLQITFLENAKVQSQIENQQILIDKLNVQISTLQSYYELLNQTMESMNASLQVLANKKECSQL